MVPPLLVVHDAGDREIPVRGGEALAKAWPGAEFEETSGLGHYRILQDSAVVRMAVDFVAGSAALVGGRTEVREG
jgi:pimeloyl-ACP methyl ester carboxylesterase